MTVVDCFPSARHTLDGLTHAGLDLLGVGFAVIGPAGRVLVANNAFRAALSHAGRGLIWRGGALRARRSRDMQALDIALSAALQGGRSLVRVEDIAGESALELLAAGLGGDGAQTDCAAAIIREPDGASPDADSLAALYGLTPAEAGLAEALIRGMGLAGACQARGISINTGKGYLKRIFEKTGTCRQSELVAMVMQGVAPFSATHGSAALTQSA